ncbi:MAG: ABC transporter permease [Deltaproteobacteria bacterium]|nr:ABC transporter permease [Kofleriaceae bacterium]
MTGSCSPVASRWATPRRSGASSSARRRPRAAASTSICARPRRSTAPSCRCSSSSEPRSRRGGTIAAEHRGLPLLVARAGTDAIPIVLVLNLLAGFVMAYQATRPLELYGANVFVADIVGISVTRELAPLMTAIIIAGRSGAGYAAELGTMRVSEEIDALRTMGFDPLAFLVLPRIATLAIVAPLLTLMGETVGVLGGVGVAVASLDLTPEAYLYELRTAVVVSDIWTGLVKSTAFGMAIAVIGCRQGLITRGAAAGVGQSTTRTVVQALFAIVVLDTMFTMFFRVVGV